MCNLFERGKCFSIKSKNISATLVGTFKLSGGLNQMILRCPFLYDRPYKIPNDKLIYIDVSSNHPPQIKKQLTKIISDRLSRNSSNADIFNNTKLEYEEALKKCGHATKLTYTRPNHEQNNIRRKGQRKIIWFNPSFNLDVPSNAADIFLDLIEKKHIHV